MSLPDVCCIRAGNAWTTVTSCTKFAPALFHETLDPKVHACVAVPVPGPVLPAPAQLFAPTFPAHRLVCVGDVGLVVIAAMTLSMVKSPEVLVTATEGAVLVPVATVPLLKAAAWLTFVHVTTPPIMSDANEPTENVAVWLPDGGCTKPQRFERKPLPVPESAPEIIAMDCPPSVTVSPPAWFPTSAEKPAIAAVFGPLAIVNAGVVTELPALEVTDTLLSKTTLMTFSRSTSSSLSLGS
jgi:hypothetical protein